MSEKAFGVPFCIHTGQYNIHKLTLLSFELCMDRIVGIDEAYTAALICIPTIRSCDGSHRFCEGRHGFDLARPQVMLVKP
jgi:hypothetical protein